MIAFAAVEGIFFSGSFASIFWLKKRCIALISIDTIFLFRPPLEYHTLTQSSCSLAVWHYCFHHLAFHICTQGSYAWTHFLKWADQQRRRSPLRLRLPHVQQAKTQTITREDKADYLWFCQDWARGMLLHSLVYSIQACYYNMCGQSFSVTYYNLSCFRCSVSYRSPSLQPNWHELHTDEALHRVCGRSAPSCTATTKG